MTTNCPICSTPSTEVVHRDRKNNIDLCVYRCRTCKLDYLNYWDDARLVKSFYDGDKYIFSANVSDTAGIRLKFNEYDEYFSRIQTFLRPHYRVLEIGCGDGTFLRRVRHHVAVADGLELSPPQVQRLRSEGFTCFDVPLEELEVTEPYDVICMFALLEHVPNLRAFLDKLKTFLHPQGQIFLEVPNLNCALVSAYDIPEFRSFYYRPIHLYYFTPEAITRALALVGLTTHVETLQQASLTNHAHWAYRRAGQPTANHMTSAIPFTTLLCDGHRDTTVIQKILDTTDTMYREQLEQNGMGDLIFARAQHS